MGTVSRVLKVKYVWSRTHRHLMFIRGDRRKWIDPSPVSEKSIRSWLMRPNRRRQRPYDNETHPSSLTRDRKYVLDRRVWVKVDPILTVSFPTLPKEVHVCRWGSLFSETTQTLSLVPFVPLLGQRNGNIQQKTLSKYKIKSIITNINERKYP